MASINIDENDGPCSRQGLLALAALIAFFYGICTRFCRRDDGSEAPRCPCKLLAILAAMAEFLWFVLVCGGQWPQARRRTPVTEPERT